MAGCPYIDGGFGLAHRITVQWDGLMRRRGGHIMVSIGLVGAGAMGSALGANWRAGGAEVVTCVVDRSARTRELVSQAGIDTVESLEEVTEADIVASVVPPADATVVANTIAAAANRAGATPLVIDLNAIAPSTVDGIATALKTAGLDLVDGSISGPPPRPGRSATRIYLSGPRANEVAELASPWAEVIELPGPAGRASALKMCTASMYKGTNALIMQAMLTARTHGVVEEFLADVAHMWPENVPHWHTDVAMAASKSGRFVGEMREIARTQGDAGLPPDLFEGIAAAYARAAETEFGHTDPERISRDLTVDQVLDGLE